MRGCRESYPHPHFRSLAGRGERLASLGVLLLIVLAGLWLRWSLNGVWRLGPDEALYASWARRIADGSDVWLAFTPGVDKPPLHIYAIAAAMQVYGHFEFATRFPSIIASTAIIWLTYVLAHRLYPGNAALALLAGLLAALSPFAILYAPTAYADPLMVMWLFVAAVLAQSGRWAWAGVAAALAVLTKQEAPLLFPLLWLLAYSRRPGVEPGGSAVAGSRRPGVEPGDPSVIRGQLFAFLAVAAVVAVVAEALWEAQRPGQPSPFALGLTNYGGIGLVPAADIILRLAAWWNEGLRYVFVSPALNLVLLAGVPGLLLMARGPRARSDRLLCLAIAYGLLARTLISFQIWHRYMLVLAPLLCIVLARVISWAWGALLVLWGRQGVQAEMEAGDHTGSPLYMYAPLVMAAALLLAPVGDALTGRIPVGSDHGVYWGIDETARFVRDNVPPGSVIYHHSLGWQFAYYLYGAHLDFWWYPSLPWLAQTAAARAGHSQYIVVPSWEPSSALAIHLAQYELVLLPVHAAHRPDGSVAFEAYRIAPRNH